MSARGENQNQTVTARGRERFGFIWAMPVAMERRQQFARAA
jgi:hypothetical protein